MSIPLGEPYHPPGRKEVAKQDLMPALVLAFRLLNFLAREHLTVDI